MNKKDIYQKIKNYFVDKPVKKISVFGSYARNEQKTSSDIDILVTPERPLGLMALSGYRIELEKILGLHVDLGTDKGISSFVIPYIQNDIEILYEKP
ncbi:MAG: nucleotidyltransferase domain-containing protein [Bacteroidetes bacterium]|nr:nucleotidyltransferase domain-containing protein [Bacteroidota bacterium]